MKLPSNSDNTVVPLTNKSIFEFTGGRASVRNRKGKKKDSLRGRKQTRIPQRQKE